MTFSVDQLLLKAKSHVKNGDIAEAEDAYRTILTKFPGNKRAQQGLAALTVPRSTQIHAAPAPEQVNALIALYNQGRLQDVVERTSALVEHFPQAVALFNILGAANAGLRRLEAAIENYHRALQIKPDFAEVHSNLGNVLKEKGDLTAALASYHRALRIKPDLAEVHSNLGNALNERGDLTAAIESYNRALQIKPDFAEAHSNLGNVLREKGDLSASIESYNRALQIKPDFAEAHSSLGRALGDQGRLDEAIASCRTALALAPNRRDFWESLAISSMTPSFTIYTQDWADTFLCFLETETLVRPSDLVQPILSLLKLHPTVKEALDSHKAGNLPETFEDVCNALTSVPLFLRVIELCLIPDLDIENLLKSLRRNLLLNSSAVLDKPGILGFQSSLALHCFTNEFVFGETEEELSAIQVLEGDITSALGDAGKPDSYKIACLASYRPLHEYQWSHDLDIPHELQDLFRRQVKQVAAEASLRPTISCLKTIQDEASSAVREQYEENPYPRWINTHISAKPTSVAAFVRRHKLRLVGDRSEFSGQPEILVAGCGTGQHSLRTAGRFANSSVLAVDLSLSSLSYALRKTTELRITNIEYMQADILDLTLLRRQFDIVESAGVLHHMADPMAGWKVLTDCLKSGGLMKIGLYSELARQHVVHARQKIAQLGLSNVRNKILQFREDIIHSNDAVLRKLLPSSDFYSTSTLRDLLFHVQEHRFTLPQIKQNLKELGLVFAGFEFAHDAATKRFKETYPAPEAVYDLHLWNEFEVTNPDTFIGMYQFWAQKNG